jgi:hypothetical protein
VLLFGVKRDVGKADVERPGEEVPCFGGRHVVGDKLASLGVGRIRQRAVHDTPLAIDQNCIPPVIRTRKAVEI